MGNDKLLALRGEDGEAATVTIRAGISVGPVIAAVIGQSQLEFDVFGTMVNFSSRLLTSIPEDNRSLDFDNFDDEFGESSLLSASNNLSNSGRSNPARVQISFYRVSTEF